MRTRRRFTTGLGFAAGLAVLAAMPGPARAQYGGLGAGWGWGIFGVGPSPSTTFLNDHANTRTALGRYSSRSHSAYRNNPNSYFNRIRDNGFVSHYDTRRRRAPSYQSGRTNSSLSREEPQRAASAADLAAITPLASFFDASLRLVWPQGSPEDGEFREKREISDRAALAVLKEKREQGAASITVAVEARQKLVEYGQPALRLLREVATPPVADSFHGFLLSLYDSLGAATLPADAVAGARP